MIDNLRLDIIATFKNKEQDHFSCAIPNNVMENKSNLLDYIKEQLLHPNGDSTIKELNKALVKLSLCWECSKKVVDKYKVIQESIEQNGKYYFENGKEKR